MVTIIIVTYNPGEDLQYTLSSIFEQTYDNYEIVIIDGNSDCQITKMIIEENRYRINKIVIEDDKGIYDAMNKGIDNASGDFIIFLNAGDSFASKTVIQKISPYTNFNNIIYGNTLINNHSEIKLQKSLSFNLFNLIVYGARVVCHQSIFVRRDIAVKYNTDLKYKAELNWYYDIVRKTGKSRIKKLDIPISNFSLGGFGDINYIENQKEKLKLNFERFNILAVFSIPVTIYGIISNYRRKK